MDLFRSPVYLLWALAAVAGAGLLGTWAERRRRRLAELFAGPVVLAKLFPQSAIRARRNKLVLSAAGLALVLTALAGPQWGVELVSSRTETTQVLLAVDTSESMLAEDLKPNRMEKAKAALTQLIDGLKGSRIGVIAFAGDAFIQCPITTDHDAAKSLLGRIEVGLITRPGSLLAKPIELGTKQLSRYPGKKALVLLTDGEDTGSAPLMAAKAAADAGVRLLVIGMGTLSGEPIPIKDASGAVTGYKRDKEGKTVVTRLGESSLVELAAASGGAYFRASAGEEEIPAILRAVENLDKTEAGSSQGNRFMNRFRFPLFAAILLLLAEFLIPEVAAKRVRSRPARVPAAAAALFISAAGNLCAAPGAPSEVRIWKGNKVYAAEDYGEALKEYQRANAEDPRTRFNAGAALYKLGDYEGAQEMFGTVLDPRAVPKGMAPKAYYNLGNSLYKEKKFPEAAEAYKKCLLLDPNEEDCRHNLVLAMKPRRNRSKDPNQKNKDDKKQDKKDQDKSGEGKGEPPPPKDRPRPRGLSKEDAERILRAVREKEKAAQKKLDRRQGSPQIETPEKDW